MTKDAVIVENNFVFSPQVVPEWFFAYMLTKFSVLSKAVTIASQQEQSRVLTCLSTEV